MLEKSWGKSPSPSPSPPLARFASPAARHARAVRLLLLRARSFFLSSLIVRACAAGLFSKAIIESGAFNTWTVQARPGRNPQKGPPCALSSSSARPILPPPFRGATGSTEAGGSTEVFGATNQKVLAPPGVTA